MGGVGGDWGSSGDEEKWLSSRSQGWVGGSPFFFFSSSGELLHVLDMRLSGIHLRRQCIPGHLDGPGVGGFCHGIRSKEPSFRRLLSRDILFQFGVSGLWRKYAAPTALAVQNKLLGSRWLGISRNPRISSGFPLLVNGHAQSHIPEGRCGTQASPHHISRKQTFNKSTARNGFGSALSLSLGPAESDDDRLFGGRVAYSHYWYMWHWRSMLERESCTYEE